MSCKGLSLERCARGGVHAGVLAKLLRRRQYGDSQKALKTEGRKGTNSLQREGKYHMIGKKGILKHLAWGGGSDRQRAEFKGIAAMLSSSDFTERPWHNADENISC